MGRPMCLRRLRSQERESYSSDDVNDQPEHARFSCWVCSQWLAAQNRYKRKGSRPVSDFTRPQQPPRKRPEEIIALRVAAAGSTPHLRLAMVIISDLHKNGYQIVRQRDQSNEGEKS
jgi:hypothetical protein